MTKYYIKNSTTLGIYRFLATFVDIFFFLLILTFTGLLKIELSLQQLLITMLFILYPISLIFCEYYFGCFVGKYMFGLRIVDIDTHNNISLLKSFIRFVLKYSGLIISLGTISLYSFFRIINTNYNQTNSDLIVNSKVVKIKGESVPTQLSLERKEIKDEKVTKLISTVPNQLVIDEINIVHVLKSMTILRRLSYIQWFYFVSLSIIFFFIFKMF